jgi:tetratricopeptide (TPR) repeat protein
MDDNPLVGHDAELAHFDALMNRVSAGDNAALILTGEEGVGKTTLLNAFQSKAEAAGWVTLSGGCDESTADNPYAPFLATLGLCFDAQGRIVNDRSVTSIVDSLPLDDILSAVTDIPGLGIVAALGLVGKRVIDARRRPLEGEELLNRNFEFVRQVFEQIAHRRKHPILLRFDDLQHAGETTLVLASYLLTRAADVQILFVGAWQPTLAVPHSPPAIRRLGETRPLTAFDREQARALVESIAPNLPLSPDRLARIVEFSHGLPGLIVEIVNLLQEGDDLLAAPPTDGEPSLSTSALTTLGAIARRYLERYPPPTLSLLECAAALGRRFPASVLAAEPMQTYLGLNERRILEILAQLAQEGRVLILTEDDDVLQFTSDYLHACLCQRLTGPLARRDRLRIAQAWQQTDPDAPPGPLARHFFQGRDYAAALEQAARAAEALVRNAAYPEAMAVYELALTALDRLPPTEERAARRLALLRAAAFAAEQSGEWTLAIRRLEKALSLVGSDQAHRAEFLGSLGWLHFEQGNLARAMAHLQQSADLYAHLQDLSGQAQIDYYLGAVHTAQKNWSQAIEHFKACIAASEKLGLEDGLARAYLELGNLVRLQRRWAEAEELLHKGIALAESSADYSALAEGYHYLGVALGRQEKPKAIEYLNQALEIARQRTRQPYQEAKILNTLAETHVRFNRWNEAVAAFEASEAIKRRLGDKPGLAMTYGGLGRLYHRQWRAALAAEYYQKDLDILREEAEANVAWIQQLLNSLAEVHRLAGNPGAAEAALAEALALADRIPDEGERNRSRGYTHLGLARLALQRHRPDAARPHVEQAQTLLHGTWMAPEADRIRAWLERLAGNLDEAQTWLDKALPRLEQSEDYERLMGAHEAAQLAQARSEVESARRWWQKTLDIAARLANEPLQRAAHDALAAMREA